MFGRGLRTGLGITMRELFNRKVTEPYPEVKPNLPERFHGRFVLDVEKCIGCGLCARACPNKVIEIKTERVEKKRVLTGYKMNIQYCLFCGLCVEACNRGALSFSKVFEMAQYYKEDIPLVFVDPREKAKTGPGACAGSGSGAGSDLGNGISSGAGSSAGSGACSGAGSSAGPGFTSSPGQATGFTSGNGANTREAKGVVDIWNSC